MSRVARIVVPGYPHHVTQRGNRRADVFETDDDRHAYLRFLKKYGERHGLDIWAYCLMTNHIHLVAVPEREESLARALRDAHTVYAMRFNTRTQMSGHVWQGRFYSCVLDESHLWAAVRYVERNPVRAGMVDRAEDHPWSSARAHCGLGLSQVEACETRDCPYRTTWTRYYRRSFPRPASLRTGRSGFAWRTTPMPSTAFAARPAPDAPAAGAGSWRSWRTSWAASSAPPNVAVSPSGQRKTAEKRVIRSLSL
jgi:REP element-mobilizing transposase RayT